MKGLKLRLLSGFFVLSLATFSQNQKAHAFVDCMVPGVFCGVTVALIAGGVAKSVWTKSSNEYTDLEYVEVSKDTLDQITVDFKSTTLNKKMWREYSLSVENPLTQLISLGKSKQIEDQPGLFQLGTYKGLKSLLNENPQLVTELEQFKALLRAYVDDEVVDQVYPTHSQSEEVRVMAYVALANEALKIRAHTWE